MKKIMTVIAVLFIKIALANNYYVDPSSTAATQNGSINSPWKTMSQVQSGMNSFAPGDFIYFKKGQTFTGTLTVTKSGTPGLPITFSCYGTDLNKPSFTGNGSNTVSKLFTLSNCQYLVFDNLNVTDPTLMSDTGRIQSAHIQIAFSLDNSHYNTFSNLEISYIGVGINCIGNFNTMKNCNVANLRMIRNTPTSVNSNDDYGGNPIVLAGSDNLVTNNYFDGCWARSYDYYFDGGAVEIFDLGGGVNRNVICYNTAIHCNGFMEFGSNVSGGGSAADNKCYYNKIINCGGMYINNGSPYTINPVNLQFYNNVWVQLDAFFAPVADLEIFHIRNTVNTQGLIVAKNNIFYLRQGVDVCRSGQWNNGQLIHENNIYNLGTGSALNFTLGSTELTTTANIWADISSSDPSVWNFNLEAVSAANNFGQSVGIDKDFIGTPIATVPDAGILEQLSIVPLPPDTTVIPPVITPPSQPFFIYYNPSFTIKLNAKKSGHYRILNYNGQTKKTGYYSKGIVTINVGSLSTGSYVFNAFDAGVYPFIVIH